jgi:hypothetical protein
MPFIPCPFACIDCRRGRMVPIVAHLDVTPCNGPRSRQLSLTCYYPCLGCIGIGVRASETGSVAGWDRRFAGPEWESGS